MKLLYVVPALNPGKRLRDCLSSIIEQETTNIDIEILLVDNGSTDGSTVIATELGLHNLLCTPRGRSFARNSGAAWANSDFIAFVDSDVVLPKDWTKTLMELFSCQAVAAVQGAIVPEADSSTWLARYRLERKRQETFGNFIEMNSPRLARPLLDSAAFIVRRWAFDLVGGFNPDLVRGEDLDFSERLVEAGLSLRMTAKVKAKKYEDRGPIKFLCRSISMAHHHYRYQIARQPGTGRLFLSAYMRYWPQFTSDDIRVRYFHHLMILGTRIGALSGLFRLPYKITAPKMMPAKINHLLPTITHEGKALRLSSSKRFSLGDDLLIFYGFTNRSALRFTDKNLVEAFRSYLDGETKDTSPLLPLIAERIFVEANYV